jgi:outer membrane protein assembly factor BamB
MDMRVGDRLPSFTGQAIDEFGAPIDVTGYRAWLELFALDSDTVFGQPSPYTPECSISDPVLGVVRYDWSQTEVDAATPGEVMVRVRFVQIADPDVTFTVPSRREAVIVMRPFVEGGRVYLTTDDGGALLLDDNGQPIVAV